MEYKIELWEAMDLLVHANDFHAETSEKDIPVFWDEYYANGEYRKIPGYLGVCAQKKTDGDQFHAFVPAGFRRPVWDHSGFGGDRRLDRDGYGLAGKVCFVYAAV